VERNQQTKQNESGSKFDRENVRCSFCGKHQDQVDKIIAGAKVYICDQCVDMCVGILEESGLPENECYDKFFYEQGDDTPEIENARFQCINALKAIPKKQLRAVAIMLEAVSGMIEEAVEDKMIKLNTIMEKIKEDENSE
jgi:hypothetical protein